MEFAQKVQDANGNKLDQQLVAMLTKIQSAGWDFKAYRKDTPALKFESALDYLDQQKIELKFSPPLMSKACGLLGLNPNNAQLDLSFFETETLISLCLLLDLLQSTKRKESASWSVVWSFKVAMPKPFGFLVNERLGLCLQIDEDVEFKSSINQLCIDNSVIYTCEDVNIVYEMATLMYQSIQSIIKDDKTKSSIIEVVEEEKVKRDGDDTPSTDSTHRQLHEYRDDELATELVEIGDEIENVNVNAEKNSQNFNVNKELVDSNANSKPRRKDTGFEFAILSRDEWIMIGLLPVALIVYYFMN